MNLWSWICRSLDPTGWNSKENLINMNLKYRDNIDVLVKRQVAWHRMSWANNHQRISYGYLSLSELGQGCEKYSS